jgi:stringent starvation protein B
LQKRYGEMLAACRAASAVECVIVAPSMPGVMLPEHLFEEALVRLNLFVGRDTPQVLLDEWGIRCTLTFHGTRHECAIPWQAVLAGILRPPDRRRPRFGVIEGGKKD